MFCFTRHRLPIVITATRTVALAPIGNDENSFVSEMSVVTWQPQRKRKDDPQAEQNDYEEDSNDDVLHFFCNFF